MVSRAVLAVRSALADVPLASRSRKVSWRMSSNSIVQAAMTNEWLDEARSAEMVTPHGVAWSEAKGEANGCPCNGP